MSAIPQAVRRQAQRAEQLAAEHRAHLNGTTPPANGAPPAAAPPSENVPADTPAAPTAAAPPSTPPAAPPAENTWERKYQVLQGKYNKEIPELRRQVAELLEDNKATRNLLAAMSSGPRARQPEPAAPPAPPAAPQRLVTEDEEKLFGKDLVGVMRRAAREEISGMTAEFDRRLAPVNQRIDQVAATARTATTAVVKKSKQDVLDHLDGHVPAWRTLNEDPGFLAWLGEVETFSGQERGALLTAAFESFDAPRVEAFFTGYQKEHAAVTPPAPTPPPTPAPAAPAPGTQVTLESLAAPGTPKPGAPRTPDGAEKRIWTRSEIRQFYRETQSGKYKGTPEQRIATERDIFAATQEGRIRER